VLVYVTETKFYREKLGISYEFGSYLRKRGALSVDAQMDDGRPLFFWIRLNATGGETVAPARAMIRSDPL
jgi:hypothetical protein